MAGSALIMYIVLATMFSKLLQLFLVRQPSLLWLIWLPKALVFLFGCPIRTAVPTTAGMWPLLLGHWRNRQVTETRGLGKEASLEVLRAKHMEPVFFGNRCRRAVATGQSAAPVPYIFGGYYRGGAWVGSVTYR